MAAAVWEFLGRFLRLFSMPTLSRHYHALPSVLVPLVSFSVFAFAMSPRGALAGAGTAPNAKLVKTGKTLFTKNCASCHGANAKGGVGPKLQGITASDARITKIIKNGKPGQMPAFGEKLKAADIRALIAYLRSLK